MRMDEADLVAALKGGELVAKVTVVETHDGVCFASQRFLCGDRDHAPYLLQDVFIAASSSVHRFREHSNLYTRFTNPVSLKLPCPSKTNIRQLDRL